MMNKNTKIVLAALLLIGSLVAVAKAETDYVSMPYITDIRIGNNTHRAIEDLYVRDDGSIGDDLRVGDDLVVTGDVTAATLTLSGAFSAGAASASSSSVSGSSTVGGSTFNTPVAASITNAQILSVTSRSVVLLTAATASTNTVANPTAIGQGLQLINVGTNTILLTDGGNLNIPTTELGTDDAITIRATTASNWVGVGSSNN